MSARLARVLATAGAAALAVTLVSPATAFADDERGSSASRGSAAKAAEGKGDPAGNNGTIKIDYAAPADSGHANRPHPGCSFQLRMFNFDDDQTGTITFTGQAPTKLGTLLTQTGKLLSDDAAGGGSDVDSVYSYTAADLGLTTQPQAAQGWHVKVTVDADDAPGGAKQKVFWLKCPVAATQGTTEGTTTEGATTSGGSTGTTGSTGTKTETVTVQGVTGGAATTAVDSTAKAAGVVAQALTAGETSFTGGSAGAVRGASAPTTGAGTALPFTGIPVLSLVAIALATLVAGGLAIWAGRRRTSSL